MGRLDKDRFQKELAIQFCLAKGYMPFLEVLVNNIAEYTDSNEVLTDIDVLGVGLRGDGDLIRTLFDCKSGSKMSAMNRAFWAAGLLRYTQVDDAAVILKATPVRSHRLSALRANVDLHDEESFRDLGRTLDPNFPRQTHYQSCLANWEKLLAIYAKNAWSLPISLQIQSAVPLTHQPAAAFRKLLAELRAVRGNFDPSKQEHVAILCDVAAASFVLWSSMGRDIRRFYDPKMDKSVFEGVLRYYLWGGRDAYQIRQQLSDRIAPTGEQSRSVELPDWQGLIRFAGLIINSPQSALASGMFCKELSLRLIGVPTQKTDEGIIGILSHNNNVRPFAKILIRYLVSACSLPAEFVGQCEGAMNWIGQSGTAEEAPAKA